MTKWQTIETAPEEERVLVFDPLFEGGRVMEAVCKGSYGWSDPVFNEWYCNPTHWMPLPNPPEEEVQ